MSSDDSTPARQNAPIDSGKQQPALATEGHLLEQPPEDIPALLDWIEEAQAATWTPIAIISIASVIVVLAVLLAVRLGWLPS
jgi:hypothetical protein